MVILQHYNNNINYICVQIHYTIKTQQKMTKSKLEYIWLDGYQPTQNMRSKTKIVNDFSGKLEDCPMWSFDGSSTLQASGGSSDCLLKASRYLSRS